jgi:hypothetical protein
MQIIKKEYWDFRFFLQDGKEAIKELFGEARNWLKICQCKKNSYLG